MKKITKLCAVALLSTMGAAAQAAIMNVTIGATVTHSYGLGTFVPVGSSLALTLYLDTDNPDADPTVGAFTATNNSNLDSFLIVPVTGSAAVSSSGSNNWSATGLLDLTATIDGLYLPYSVTISGTGMTPDQILPNFSSVTGGLITVDTSQIVDTGTQILATVNSVSISEVPVPAAAWLFGSSVLGLAGVARRRAA